MDDDVMWSRSERTAVRELVAPPDVAVAWDGLSTRLRKARRRRLAGRGVVATVVVAVAAAVTVAGVSRRSPTEQQVDSAGPASSPVAVPAPAAPEADEPEPFHPEPWDPESGLTFDEYMQQPIPPDLSSGDLLVVSCADGVGSVDRTVAAVGPRGLSVEQRGGSRVNILSSDRRTKYQMTYTEGPVDEGRQKAVEIVPGTYDIVCGSQADVWDTDAVIATVEVTDPDGWYTPGDVFPSICPGARGEDYELGSLTFDEFTAWRFGVEDVARYGYEGSSSNEFEVPGATGTFERSRDGGSVRLMICDGAAPLPDGDGLSPASTVRTDAEAAAWLDEHVPTAGLYTLPAGAVIERTDARLVRFDDVPGSVEASAPAPGFSVWVVSATYRTPDGATGNAIYAFSTDPRPDDYMPQINYVDPENDPNAAPDPNVYSWPPSIPDPQAWFDSLIDQAD